jgi:CheY-like chemotaxis protein
MERRSKSRSKHPSQRSDHNHRKVNHSGPSAPPPGANGNSHGQEAHPAHANGSTNGHALHGEALNGSRRFHFATTPLTEALQHASEVNGKPVTASPRVRSQRVAPQLTILVVDDERTIADTLGMILQGRGYGVAVAYDGREGLEQFDRVRPDLVLSDVVMPGMDGVAMAIEIRRRGGCPILLFSGQAVTSDLLERARQHGQQFELLMKPIHPTELLERIALCIGVGHSGVMREAHHAGAERQA